jgi:hypothetical protein
MLRWTGNQENHPLLTFSLERYPSPVTFIGHEPGNFTKTHRILIHAHRMFDLLLFPE